MKRVASGIPLTACPGDPVIGEAELIYDEGDGVLRAKFRVEDPNVAEILGQEASALIYRES